MTKTIFYGNGLNYHSLTKDSSVSWTELLETIMQANKFNTDFIPNTMSYERIRLNWNKNNNSHLKTKIKELLINQPANPYYNEILNIKDCNNFITTNYDYALNKTFSNSDKDFKVDYNSEELYSIRRNTEFESGRKIWNIHGEVNKPKSIMLGLNHYCGSIGKIDAYLKGRYNFRHKEQKEPIIKIEEKLKANKFDGYSWIELFFNSNMHIIGFSLDYSEIDLWWLITKRARLMENDLIFNEITFYTKPISELELAIDKENNEQKKRKLIVQIDTENKKMQTLRDFGINVKEISKSNGYNEHWNNIFSAIKNASS